MLTKCPLWTMTRRLVVGALFNCRGYKLIMRGCSRCLIDRSPLCLLLRRHRGSVVQEDGRPKLPGIPQRGLRGQCHHGLRYVRPCRRATPKERTLRPVVECIRRWCPLQDLIDQVRRSKNHPFQGRCRVLAISGCCCG
jgi:hypothetical protein